MRTSRRGRSATLALLCAWAVGCGPAKVAPPPTPATKASAPAVLKDEIPAEQLIPVLAANSRGLGLMERYEYAQAGRSFREVRRLAPGWLPGSINLAIALLNDNGTKAEEAKKKGEDAPASNFDEALKLLGDVIARDPKNLHAHFCRGLIYETQGSIAEAHADYRAVAEGDPSDPNALYKVASTLPDPPGPSGAQEKARETIQLLTRALELNPYLVSALYRLQAAYRSAGDRAKQTELLALWTKLNPKSNAAAPGELVENFYGESGRYARIIHPSPAVRPGEDAPRPPRFAPPAALAAQLPEGCRWARDGDFVGPHAVIGRARKRFGAAVAAFDANGDGKMDMYLAAAVVGSKGLRDALLLNNGDDTFTDATLRYGLPEDRASIGVAAGDFDADNRVDLYLTGVGDNRLYRNVRAYTLNFWRFVDMTTAANPAGPKALSLSARWVDLDQDGDLDLYVVNYTDAGHAGEALTDTMVPGVANAAFRNDGVPPPTSLPAAKWMPLAGESPGETSGGGLSIRLTPWPDAPALLGGEARHTGVAAAYLDDDRDLDLILVADGRAPVAVLNDRLGRFHEASPGLPANPSPSASVIAVDLDKDGRPDLVEFSEGPARAWRNTSTRSAEGYRLAFEPIPTPAAPVHDAVACDLDLDSWVDLVAIGAGGPGSPDWLRFGPAASPKFQTLALAPDPAGVAALCGLALADIVGDALPDLILWRDGAGPSVAANLGNGRHWLSLDLGGRWKNDFGFMRTNPHAIGTRVTVEGQGLLAPVDLNATESGPAQSVAPAVVGLGDHASADLVRLRWPDGVMQCELNVPADQVLSLAENNRKTGSCPVLFTWNGARFDCIGDFLGGGGLGFLVAPGLYGQPDRDEAVLIRSDQLAPVVGVLRLAIAEPMDELAYIDRLTLDAVDHPPGVSVALDERFAPEGPRPSGELVAYRSKIEPITATDLKGMDITSTLRDFDRSTAEFPRLDGWIGYAEEHGIVLDFGDRLRDLSPGTPLVLALAGWVEYPYSQTNYAAASAGVALRPPVLERREADGSWEVLEASPGYPAGLPRMTTLDLTGKLGGPRCVLRLRTNMECYYDQAFLAVRDPDAGVRVTTLAVSRAALAYRGYLREVSPDGRLPLLYDHDYADPAPLARLDGHLTRYGDVAPLLRDDDDRQCLVGPGDEAKVEFDARSLPPLPAGWTRSYVLRSIGYCKDADPNTAASDTVGPLPWKGMPAYPFGPEGDRPRDPEYDAYLRTYQTRPTGVR